MTDQTDLIVKAAHPRSIREAPPYISRSPLYLTYPTVFNAEQWRMVAREPITRLCIRHILRELVALEWDITSDNPDRDKETIINIKTTFDHADDGDGWDAFLSRVLQDAMELPTGGFAELSPDDITGLIGGLYHIDAGTMYPTYDLQVPWVQINPYDSTQRIFFKNNEIGRLVLNPRTDIRKRPFQESPVESAFMSIEALSRIYIYYLKQLGDTPMAGILDVMDMSETEAIDWAKGFREMYSGIDPLKVPLLYDHTKPARFIPLSHSPDVMGIAENFKRFAEMVASAFGLSIGDLRMFEHERVLAGVEASQRVTARSGIGFYAQAVEDLVNNRILFSVRSGFKFKFKLGMTGELQADTQLAMQRAQLLDLVTGKQPLLTQADAQKQAREWKIFDIEPTGMPQAAAAGGPGGPGGPGGAGALMAAGSNLDSVNQNADAVSKLANEAKPPENVIEDGAQDVAQMQATQKGLLFKNEPGGHDQNTHGHGEGKVVEESPKKGGFKKVDGTLPVGTKLTTVAGDAAICLGWARQDIDVAKAASKYWSQTLGVIVEPMEANGVYQLVVVGDKIPTPKDISEAKKAKDFKVGTEGFGGVVAGKRYDAGEANALKAELEKQTGAAHDIVQKGGVYLVVATGAKAAKTEGPSTPTEPKHLEITDLYGTNYGNKFIYSGEQVTLVNAATSSAANLSSNKAILNAQAAALQKKGTDAEVLQFKKGTKYWLALVTIDNPKTPASKKTGDEIPDLVDTKIGGIPMKVKPTSPGLATYNSAMGLKKDDESVVLANDNKWYIIKTDPNIPAWTPTVIGGTAVEKMTEPPAAGSKAVTSGGSAVEIVPTASQQGKPYYFQEKNAAKKANELMAANPGTAYMAIKAPIPEVNTLVDASVGYYVGKVLQPGTDAPAPGTAIPVPQTKTPYFSPEATVHKPIDLSAGLNTPKAPIVPKPPVATIESAPVTPIPNNTKGFPDSLASLKAGKVLGGSSQARLYTDKAGNQFVVKMSNSPEQSVAENDTLNIYRAMGVRVPDAAVIQTPDGPAQISRYIPDLKPLSAFTNNAAKMAELRPQIQAHFATDVLMANRDVAGASYDNLMVDSTGKVWRIEGGGGLGIKAMGGDKPGWNEHPTDLWTMRDPKMNPTASDVFKGMSWSAVTKQMGDVVGRKKEILDAISDEPTRALVEKRIEAYRELVHSSQAMLKDSFSEQYVEDFSKARVDIGASGIRDMFAKSLAPDKAPHPNGTVETTWYDQDGKEWDNLRNNGANGIVAKMSAYMKANGGSWDHIANWLGDHAGSAWSAGGQAAAYHWAREQGQLGVGKSWWGHSSEPQAKAYWEKAGGEKFSKSLNMYHAFMYEMLAHIDMPNVDKETRSVRIYRTEDDTFTNKVMKSNGLVAGVQKDGITDVKHASYSSTSIAKPVLNSNIFIQNVPFHRIVAGYFHSRTSDSHGGSLYGDHENELLSLLNGVPTSYIGKSLSH